MKILLQIEVILSAQNIVGLLYQSILCIIYFSIDNSINVGFTSIKHDSKLFIKI